jgi:hypothetical protein
LGAKILSQVAQGKEIQAVAGKFRASRRFFPQPASFLLGICSLAWKKYGFIWQRWSVHLGKAQVD